MLARPSSRRCFSTAKSRARPYALAARGFRNINGDDIPVVKLATAALPGENEAEKRAGCAFRQQRDAVRLREEGAEIRAGVCNARGKALLVEVIEAVIVGAGGFAKGPHGSS